MKEVSANGIYTFWKIINQLYCHTVKLALRAARSQKAAIGGKNSDYPILLTNERSRKRATRFSSAAQMSRGRMPRPARLC